MVGEAGINLPLVTRQTGSEGIIVGLDYSIPMLEQGQEKLIHNKVPACLSAGDAEDLSFNEDSFDKVYIFGCINVLSDQGKAA